MAVVRWLNPLLFVGAGLWIRHFNATHADRALMLPLMEPFAGTDPAAQGALSWKVCLAIGAILAVFALARTVAERRRAGAPEP